jgi:hypothetical protein
MKSRKVQKITKVVASFSSGIYKRQCGECVHTPRGIWAFKNYHERFLLGNSKGNEESSCSLLKAEEITEEKTNKLTRRIKTETKVVQLERSAHKLERSTFLHGTCSISKNQILADWMRVLDSVM